MNRSTRNYSFLFSFSAYCYIQTHTHTHTCTHNTHADISALSMHVPMFPRAMHCLKVESVSPPWGGGGIKLNTLYVLHQLSSVLAQPPFLFLLFPLIVLVSISYILTQHILFIPVDNCPTPSAHPDTSSLHQFAGALESMQHCLSLFIVDFTKGKPTAAILSLFTESFSVLFCERARVKSCLPSSITRTTSNSPRRFSAGCYGRS